MQFDETGNRKRKYRYGDEDEIELEQTEMKRRRALNKEFKHFADKIAEAVGCLVLFWFLTPDADKCKTFRVRTDSRLIFHSGNWRSRVSRCVQM